MKDPDYSYLKTSCGFASVTPFGTEFFRLDETKLWKTKPTFTTSVAIAQNRSYVPLTFFSKRVLGLIKKKIIKPIKIWITEIVRF